MLCASFQISFQFTKTGLKKKKGKKEEDEEEKSDQQQWQEKKWIFLSAMNVSNVDAADLLQHVYYRMSITLPLVFPGIVPGNCRKPSKASKTVDNRWVSLHGTAGCLLYMSA